MCFFFFLFTKSTLELFLKDHVTENWSNDAENSALLSQEEITF